MSIKEIPSFIKNVQDFRFEENFPMIIIIDLPIIILETSS